MGLKSELFTNQLGLGEQKEIIAATGFGVGTGQIEAPEGMDTNQSPGALAVEIEVAGMEVTAGLF